MFRVFFAALTAAVVSVPLAAQTATDRPKEPPRETPPREKIDGKVDRTLAGHVEKVDARGETSGTLKVRTDRTAAKLYHYTFVVTKATRFVDAKNKPLADGIKSKLLAGADVVVEFVDKDPKGDKAAPDTHVARKVQLIRAGAAKSDRR